MVFITDALERIAIFYVAHVVYPAIRAVEMFLGKDLLDDDE